MFTDTEFALSERHRLELRAANSRSQNIIDRLDAKIVALRKQVEDLTLALQVERSYGVGVRAQVLAFKSSVPPDHNLLETTGYVYTDGVPQTNLSAIFDDVFDKSMAEVGLDPKNYRIDINVRGG